MRLVKSDVSKIKTYTATKLDSVVEEFIAMNTEVVEIQAWEDNYRTVTSCVNALNVALTRRKERGYKAVSRQGKPYIVKRSILGY